MTELETSIVVAFAMIAAIFVAGAVAFLYRIRTSPSEPEPSITDPKTAVLLSLRGADPHLEECLHALVGQTYPDFQVHIVVDSKLDPAWVIVNRVLEEIGADNVHVALLANPSPTCSLKCSALLQMLDGLGDNVEIVALIDSDVVPHATWLRELVGPLLDDRIGVTFGIPWYSPPKARLASIVRKVSWAPAAILMGLFGWVWGGSAALPARVFRHPTLAARWSRSVSSDAPIQEVVRALGLKTHWVPGLIMPNHEEGRFRALLSHLSRSLSTSRLYLRQWPLIFGVAILASGFFLLAAAMIIFHTMTSDLRASQITAGVLSAYWLLLMTLMITVDSRVRALLKKNGFAEPAISFQSLTKTLLAIPLAHGFYLAAVLKAAFARSLTWRGVRYVIDGRWKISRIESDPVSRPRSTTDHAIRNYTLGAGD